MLTQQSRNIKYFLRKQTRDPEITFPQQGERTLEGNKLPRRDRHRNLRRMYVMVGDDQHKPWRNKLTKAFH